MGVSECISCKEFPCADVLHQSYRVPGVEVHPEDISIILISEAAPADPKDGYYAPGDPLFARTTLQAFSDAGAQAGPSFFIEKSKRRMIAEDIAAALHI